ncbi:golgin subfamily A member 6-like protein 22 [Silurus meridionalis]|uniref:golgin subfamily A member 6-like protein 22 n=1 Tax=Silurus meridionalis TaxID=175797 RepID=UPI001EEA325B|nr:golgin subfamily A member 6-like protein 22 [Silurus meridionalis]
MELEEIFQSIREKKSKQAAEKKEALKHIEKVAAELDSFLNLIKEKRTPETEEKDILVQMVQELEATLASERKNREQEINERNATHLQNITKLLSSLKLHEEKEKIVESERESWAREQKQLQERVAQLEATLKREKGKKAKLDMEERNKLQLQTITELQDSLNYCKEERNTAKNEREILMRERRQLAEQVAQLEAVFKYERNYWEKKRKKEKRVMKTSNNLQLKTTRTLQDHADHETDHLRRDRERLEQRVAQLEATLNSEQNKFKKEKEMIKLDMEEMTTRHFQTIRELQDSLNHCEEEKIHLMRDRERLEERVAQLEETLKFVQNKFEKEKEKAKLDMEEMITRQVQTTRDLQDSLNHCEEEKMKLMRDQERLEEHVAQLEETLEFVQNKFEKETEKAKLEMEEMITSQLQTTRELQDSLNHCEEEKKIAKHERENLMRDRERLEERVAQLEATLEFKVNKFEKEKEKAKLDMEEMITSQLQTTRDLQNSLIHCEEEKKIAKHERNNLMRDGQRLEEHVAQLKETLKFEQYKFRKEKKKTKLDIEEMIKSQLQTTRDLQDSLIHCEEEKKTAKDERDDLMRDRERLEEHVAQLEETLESERNKWKEKLKAKQQINHLIHTFFNNSLRTGNGSSGEQHICKALGRFRFSIISWNHPRC